ncbi:unnamed protein product [Didymodactylos carnosus]|uniref:Uncharacterized protein n=1 Tax=Didymodactylos carnosus TaxID=1234261 RepID=A0A813PVS4_9BILA|nr:unnamed protein product [Didymodactylos carnosus]CAF1255602.1 unnamed protein product [Didymodactylos carnosus]CAF3537232.1 unnamed protein product [Didymodactylos carnosus]CAF4062668.1 unnamed protein product [Didymodactylos carnosus]
MRLIQILLTVFCGILLANGIFEYLILGIFGLVFNIRSKYDSILLILLGILLSLFSIYALIAIWKNNIKLLIVSIIILIILFILTLVKSITEINELGLRLIRTEWIAIRITELVLRLTGISTLMVYIIQLKQDYYLINS